jgi:hypothetical protein
MYVMSRNQSGFTALELIVAFVVVIAAAGLVWWQRQELVGYHQDLDRKSAINSVYYYLEEVHYPANDAYPTEVNSDTIRGVNPDMLKDPMGLAFGEPNSDYQYEPHGCIKDKCQGYSLRATLHHQNDFIKENRVR